MRFKTPNLAIASESQLLTVHSEGSAAMSAREPLFGCPQHLRRAAGQRIGRPTRLAPVVDRSRASPWCMPLIASPRAARPAVLEQGGPRPGTSERPSHLGLNLDGHPSLFRRLASRPRLSTSLSRQNWD